jgi:carbonic anhydrase/SulP family sulfate permease
LLFDLGVGDIFSVRVAGNVPSRKILGSIEYGCAVAGAKLILVMGHTRCGAVTSAVRLGAAGADPAEVTGCQHIEHILRDINDAVDPVLLKGFSDKTDAEQTSTIDQVARRNVQRTARRLKEESDTLTRLVEEGRIAIVGALYDVASGEMEFLEEAATDKRLIAELINS